MQQVSTDNGRTPLARMFYSLDPLGFDCSGMELFFRIKKNNNGLSGKTLSVLIACNDEYELFVLPQSDYMLCAILTVTSVKEK